MKRKRYFRCRSQRKAIKLALWFMMSDVEVLDIYQSEGYYYLVSLMDAIDMAIYKMDLKINKGGIERCWIRSI